MRVSPAGHCCGHERQSCLKWKYLSIEDCIKGCSNKACTVLNGILSKCVFFLEPQNVTLFGNGVIAEVIS
jgi:hypothetical protein